MADGPAANINLEPRGLASDIFETQEADSASQELAADEETYESDSCSSSSYDSEAWRVEEKKLEIYKPTSLDPGLIVTTNPGESSLCWVCRQVIHKYDETPSHRYILVIRENFVERADQGCHLCLVFFNALPLEGRDQLRAHERKAKVDAGQDLVIKYHKFEGVAAGVLIQSIIKVTVHFGSQRIPDFSGRVDLLNHAENSLSAEPWATSTGSAQSLGLSRNWIRECIIQHKACRSLASPFVPTRLIDVGAHDASRPRLCLGKDLIPSTRYLTLSHCWGRLMPRKLLTDNISSMIEDIEFGELTKTFQDAILATRELGLRYLWIDSLCILQDCQEDWQRESALMTQVYSNSLCNISATAAEDGSGGLFFDRNILAVRPVKANIKIRGIPALHVFINANFCSALEGPLTQRGWVLQERLLSPGNLHFTKNQVFWECRERLACETFPKDIPLDLDIPEIKGEIARALGTPSFLDQRKIIDPRIYPNRLYPTPLKSWTSIIKQYTNAALSYRTDRLVAIGGLAHMVQMTLKSQYFAGLWRESFADQLLWFADPPPTTQESLVYVAPSWSWAACNSRCNFRKSPGGIKTSTILDILDIKVDLVSDNPFGQVKSGYLMVASRLAKAKLLSEQRLPLSKKKLGYAVIYRLDENWNVPLAVFDDLTISLDVRGPKSEFVEEIVYFLPVNETEYIDVDSDEDLSDYSEDNDKASDFEERGAREVSRNYEVLGLVLKPAGTDLSEFSRHGIFTASRIGGEPKLRDGFRYFDRIAQDIGLKYNEDKNGEHRYLLKIL